MIRPQGIPEPLWAAYRNGKGFCGLSSGIVQWLVETNPAPSILPILAKPEAKGPIGLLLEMPLLDNSPEGRDKATQAALAQLSAIPDKAKLRARRVGRKRLNRISTKAQALLRELQAPGALDDLRQQAFFAGPLSWLVLQTLLSAGDKREPLAAWDKIPIVGALKFISHCATSTARNHPDWPATPKRNAKDEATLLATIAERILAQYWRRLSPTPNITLINEWVNLIFETERDTGTTSKNINLRKGTGT